MLHYIITSSSRGINKTRTPIIQELQYGISMDTFMKFNQSTISSEYLVLFTIFPHCFIYLHPFASFSITFLSLHSYFISIYFYWFSWSNGNIPSDFRFVPIPYPLLFHNLHLSTSVFYFSSSDNDQSFWISFGSFSDVLCSDVSWSISTYLLLIIYPIISLCFLFYSSLRVFPHCSIFIIYFLFSKLLCSFGSYG